MTPLRLSIVVPTHNTREMTLCCLRSVRRELPSAELLVVDDASSDGTEQAVRAGGLVDRWLRFDEARGFAAAANLGLDAAQGDVLLVLNSDTELEPGAAAALERAFDRCAPLGVAGARLLFPDGRPQWSGGKEPSPFWFFALGSGLASATAPWRNALRNVLRHAASRTPRDGDLALRDVDWVSGAAMAMRRSVWERCGPFVTVYRFYAQDLDLCRQASAQGFRIAILENFVVVHHLGATIRRQAPQRAERQLPSALLWLDLLTWAERSHGRRWALAARRCLFWGGNLRRVLLLARPRRAAERAALREALTAIARGRR